MTIEALIGAVTREITEIDPKEYEVLGGVLPPREGYTYLGPMTDDMKRVWVAYHHTATAHNNLGVAARYHDLRHQLMDKALYLKSLMWYLVRESYPDRGACNFGLAQGAVYAECLSEPVSAGMIN